MDLTLLDSFTGVANGLAELTAGPAQRYGTLTMVPLLGPDALETAPPSVGARLATVHTYGDVSLKNESHLPAIAPLHLGYIQHGAQNHALCRSALIAPGKEVRFTDACCVQAAQGGFLEGKAQWFFLLPRELRGQALEQRGVSGYSKLWNDIAQFNKSYGLHARGHLDELLVKQRGALNIFQSRFERLDSQRGALFFLGEKLVGLEVAPTAAYFADIWPALVCFVYGPEAWRNELSGKEPDARAFEAESLEELSVALHTERLRQERQLASCLEAARQPRPKTKPEQRWGALCLSTLTGDSLIGQLVTESGERVVWASLFAR
ncbi:MAG: hypothetical protein QM758_08905 [Armatimonas sp.]